MRTTSIPTELIKLALRCAGIAVVFFYRPLFASADSTLTDVLRSSGLEPVRPDLGSALFKMIIFLAFLLGLIFLFSYWAKKFSGQKQLGGRVPIHIISSKFMGQKRALYVVEIAQRWFVLGVSESSINLISELDKTDVEPYAHKETAAEKPFPFQSFLSRLVSNKTVQSKDGVHE